MKDETFALFVGYMNQVLKNARIDYIRKLRRIGRFEVMTGDAYEDEVAQLISDEQSLLDQMASEAFLQSVLASLSEAEAFVLYHVVCLEESTVSVARRLGITEKSVSRIKRRALTKLRTRLEGGILDDGL